MSVMNFYGIMAVLKVKYLHFFIFYWYFSNINRSIFLWLEINVVVYDQVEEKL